MKKKKKWIAVMLAISLAGMLSGCGKVMEILSQPPFEEQSQTEFAESYSTIPVNFYFDNTSSMYGFVCQNSGSNDAPVYYSVNADGSSVVTGNLLQWMRSVNTTLQNFSGKKYWLDPDPDAKKSVWAECNEEMFTAYSKSEFYTPSDTPNQDDGPLQQLFNTDYNINAVNIVMTDMAEQNLDVNTLAKHLNELLMKKEGYAAAMIAMYCDFHGTAYVPDPNHLDKKMKNQQTDAPRPLYMIICGPEKKTEDVYTELIHQMSEVNGLKEGEQYHTHFQKSITATHLTAKDIVYAPALFEDGQVDPTKKAVDGFCKKSELIEKSVFNVNLCLNKLKKEDQAAYFADDVKTNVPVFQYISKAKAEKRVVLNFYIPLVDQDVKELKAALDVNEDKGNGISEELRSKREYASYYPWLPSEEQSSNDKDSREPTGEWGEAESGNTEKDITTFVNSFTIQMEEIEDPAKVESVVLPEVLETVRNKEEIAIGDMPRVDFNLSKKLTEVLNEEDGKNHPVRWYHITVEGRDKFTNSAAAFRIPIYAVVNSDQEEPEWLNQYNANLTEEDGYTKTYYFTDFYRILFDTNKKSNMKEQELENSIHVANIDFVIYGLPSK